MDGVAQFDLVFSRGAFVGEVECKSLSADAGRHIYRKDFYRFMELIAPALATHMDLQRQEVLVITLEGVAVAEQLRPSGTPPSDRFHTA